MTEPHWSDRSPNAVSYRNDLRSDFRLGIRKPQSSENGEPEKYPGEYFKCVCGSGPWHITWGAMCPNCSGAD